MNNNQGALYFGAGVDLQQWRANMAEMRRDIQGLNTTTQQQTRQMDSSFRMVGTGLATYFSGAALANFTRQIIDVRGEFQKTEIAFGTMLKSTDKAKALMGQMVELAAKTPFSLQDVSSGAKQLLAFQVPAEQVVDTLTRMGNIAAGLGVPLSRINLVYGQVKAKGKLAGDDLRQFTEAGIPMLAELAKKFGTSTSEISKMVTAGKIGFKDVQDVLFSMTNEGGMFFNLMEKQSASLSGKMSNLSDAIDQMFNKMGQSTEGFLSDAIDSAAYLVDNYEEVLKILGVLISTYGAYRAALMLVSASQAASVAPTILTSFGTLINLIRGATSAQVAFNIAGMANPFVAIATVVVGLSTVIYAYRKELGQLIGVVKEHTASQRIQEQVMTTYNDKFGAGVIDTKSQIQNLINIIKSEYSTLKQREDAYNRLIAIDSTFRGTLDAQFRATYKLGDAFTHLISRMQRFAMAQAEMAVQAEKYKTLAESQMNLGITQVKYDDATKETKRLAQLVNSGKLSVKEYAKAVRDLGTTDLANQLVTINKTVKDNRLEVAAIGKANVKQLSDLQKGLAIQEAQIKGGKINGRTLSPTELATLKEEYKINKKIFDLKVGGEEKEQSIIPEPTKPDEEKKKKAIKNKERELAEIYSKGSIADLEQRISLWNEALQKASGDTVNELTKNKFGDTVKSGNNVSVKNALQQLEELEKAKAKRLKEISIKSFEEELTEMERQWKVRYALAEKYGEEVAKAQFPDLKGESYYANIKDKFSSLDGKLNAGISLSEEDLAQWQKLKEILDNLNGVKDPFTNYKDDLEKTLSGIESGIERIRILEKDLYTMSDADITNGKKSYLLEKIEVEKEAQRQFYQDFLKEKETFEQKKKDIDDKYNSIDAQINGSGSSADEKSRLLTESAKAKGREYSQAFLDSIKDTSMWEKAFSDIAKMTSREMKNAISDLKTQLATAKTNGATATEIKTIQDRITELQNALNTNPFEKIASSFKKLGDETLTTLEKLDVAKDLFNGLGEGVQMLGDAFGGFDEQTQDTVNSIMEIGNAAFDLGKSIASGDVAGMIQAGIKLIGSIGKALNGDKKKERNIKRQAAALKELENRYNALAFAAERAFGAQKYDGQRDLIKNLQQQKIAIEGMMRAEQSKKKADKGKIAEYQAQIQGINQSIASLKEGIIKDVLQTDLVDAASKVGDALVDAFGRGEDAVQSLENAANDMIKNLLKNQLNIALQNKMQPILDKLLKDSGFDVNGNGTFTGLTPEQIAAFKAQVVAAGQSMQGFLEGYSEIFGGIDENAQGLKGDIKGITEKTAGALEAQINAMRINQVSSLEVVRNSLLQLVAIESNTRNLIQIRQDIAEMNGKMTKGLAGI